MNFGLLALVGIIATFSRQIITFVNGLRKYFLCTITLDPILSSSVYQYCQSNMTLVNFRPRSFFGCRSSTHSDYREKIYAFDLLSANWVCFRKGFQFVLLGPGTGMNEYGSGEKATSLLIPRWIGTPEDFVRKCLEADKRRSEKAQTTNRFFIVKYHGANKQVVIQKDNSNQDTSYTSRYVLGAAYKGRAIPVDGHVSNYYLFGREVTNPFNTFPFPSDVMSYVDEAREWISMENWYQGKGIPWQLGWLLHGKPGTGKSLLIRCIAQHLNIPVFVFDLSSMNNKEFVTYWGESCANSPCLVVFEDIDAVFHGRKNVIEKSELTFDTIINCISGIERCNGIFLAITTNNLQLIDPAIGQQVNGITSRPGRIDRIIELKSMTEECRRKFANVMLGDFDVDFDEIIRKSADMTAAQFFEMCKRICVSRVLNRTVVTEVCEETIESNEEQGADRELALAIPA